MLLIELLGRPLIGEAGLIVEFQLSRFNSHRWLLIAIKEMPGDLLSSLNNQFLSSSKRTASFFLEVLFSEKSCSAKRVGRDSDTYSSSAR